MVPLLCRPPLSFSQMVCKFAPLCCCNNLGVPDFSPSRWGALFIQLEKPSHQNVYSSRSFGKTAPQPPQTPLLKKPPKSFGIGTSVLPPPLRLQLYINPERDSSSFIHFSSLRRTATHLPATGPSPGDLPNRDYLGLPAHENRHEFSVFCR